MIVDPVQAFATATSGLLATSSVAPLPTVVPSLPEYEKATDTGNRTLWYVTINLKAAMRPSRARSGILDEHANSPRALVELLSIKTARASYEPICSFHHLQPNDNH
jgi:hypothetical protein